MDAGWNLLKAALKQRAQVLQPTKMARDELARAQQKRGEKATTFVERFLATCLKIPSLTDEEKLDRFVRGLLPHYRKEIELREVTSFQDALRLAQRIDGIHDFATPCSNESEPQPMQLGAMGQMGAIPSRRGEPNYPRVPHF
jgi:hypothetical protein